MTTRRPLTLILATVLFALLTVFGLGAPFGPHGPNGGPPLPIIIYAGSVMGVGGLIALVGLWTLKRWGWLLTIIIAALTMLVSAYDLVGAPTIARVVVSGVLLAVSALVLVLVLLLATRQAVAAARAPAAQA